jgi:predicted dehydrogenase
MNKSNGQPVRMAMVGCGGMARHHVQRILQQQDTTKIVAVCEPSEKSYAAFAKIFDEASVTPPPNIPDLEQLLKQTAGKLDAAFIITPHAYHHDQAKLCMEAGVDVLLEKPMVMTAEEAEDLIAVRDRTGRLLVVAFNGSLSPEIREAVKLLRSGELGDILNISATVWQNWGPLTKGLWRQDPALSGGGFMFDTGAHMMNTVVDLAGEDFVEVAAWLDNRDTPVDVLGAIIARTASGILVTMNACGETVRSCSSDVRVFCTDGIVQTGVWGRNLAVQRNGQDDLVPVSVPETLGQWQQFLQVRAGTMPNPCPPEVGLRMARLWDAIRESAAAGGKPVPVGGAAVAA